MEEPARGFQLRPGDLHPCRHVRRREVEIECSLVAPALDEHEAPALVGILVATIFLAAVLGAGSGNDGRQGGTDPVAIGGSRLHDSGQAAHWVPFVSPATTFS